MVEAILEAAARVFESEGSAATTNRIAEQAGVSVGSLYQYFPNKEALVTALHERHLDEVAGAIIALLVDGRRHSGDETLRLLVCTLVELHHRRPNLQRLLHAEAPHLGPSPAENSAKSRLARFTREWLANAAPDRSAEEIETAARTVTVMSQSLVHDSLHCDGVMTGELAGEIFRALSAYVAAWAGGRPAATDAPAKVD